MSCYRILNLKDKNTDHHAIKRTNILIIVKNCYIFLGFGYNKAYEILKDLKGILKLR